MRHAENAPGLGRQSNGSYRAIGGPMCSPISSPYVDIDVSSLASEGRRLGRTASGEAFGPWRSSRSLRPSRAGRMSLPKPSTPSLQQDPSFSRHPQPARQSRSLNPVWPVTRTRRRRQKSGVTRDPCGQGATPRHYRRVVHLRCSVRRVAHPGRTGVEQRRYLGWRGASYLGRFQPLVTGVKGRRCCPCRATVSGAGWCLGR